MRIGLIGLGAIGQQVAEGITRGAAGDVDLCAVLVRRPRTSQVAAPMVTDIATFPAGAPVLTDLAAFLASAPGVVLEAASAEAVARYAEPVLTSGASFVVASTSGLLDPALCTRLEAVCRQSGTRVIVAAGALAGVDALAAAREGGLDDVSLRVVEPAETERVVFRGHAAEGARAFPSRLNVAATASLAASGAAEVLLEQRPGDRRIVEVTARGAFGEFTARVEPRWRADHLSHIVALSLLASVRRLQQPLQIG